MIFDYETAFSRNLGWLTLDEQQILRGKCVAIAGLGGVGGHYLLTLARMGIGSFRISDIDDFELENFNRQMGATLRTIGNPKVGILRDQALDINPELNIEIFPNGVFRYNVSDFLRGADIFVDGFDLFAIQERQDTFAMCHRMKMPAITSAPLGMGASCISFFPDKMTFEEYFRLEGHSPVEQLIRFLVGMSPRALHAKYLADFSHIDFENRQVPSTAMGCYLAAGWVGAQVVKILLGRRGMKYAPHIYHFDAYRGMMKHSWRPFGNNNPLQKIILSLARRKYARLSRQIKKELS